MLRDKNLIPLSHQHQHSLALCVRIDRASPIKDAELAVWQAEIAQHFQNEIGIHFAAEEAALFPAARQFADLGSLVEELLTDHAWLRERFELAVAQSMSATDLAEMAQRLSAHIRKEERDLFENLQRLLGEEQLSELGRRLDIALAETNSSCIVQSDATRLRAVKR